MKDALINTVAAAESDDECDHLAGQVHNKSPTRDSKYFYAKNIPYNLCNVLTALDILGSRKISGGRMDFMC